MSAPNTARNETYGTGRDIDSLISELRHVLSQHKKVLQQTHMHEEVQALAQWIEAYEDNAGPNESFIQQYGVESLVKLRNKLENNAEDYIRLEGESPAKAAPDTKHIIDQFMDARKEIDIIIIHILKHFNRLEKE